MYVKQYSEIDEREWDTFVASCSMGHTYFSYAMTALPPPREKKQKQYVNNSFGIFNEKNELLLIFQLFLWKKKQNFWERFTHKKEKIRLTSFHGLCVKDDLPNKTYKKLKETFETHIDVFFLNYKCKGLDIALPPFCNLLRPENISGINPLIHWNFSPFLGYTYVIDLEKSAEEIQAGYAQTTRNLIKHAAINKSINIFETDGNNTDYSALLKLNDLCYSNQAADKKLTDEYISALWALIRQKKVCRCFFCKEDNEVLCYIILLYFKDCAYYFWGGGVHNSQNIQRFLLHSLILQCKSEKYKWFEVGAANIWLRSGKDKSISDYKKSFSHELHPIYKGHYVIDFGK